MDDLQFSYLPLSFLCMKVRHFQYVLKIHHSNGVLMTATALSYTKSYIFFLIIKWDHLCWKDDLIITIGYYFCVILRMETLRHLIKCVRKTYLLEFRYPQFPITIFHKNSQLHINFRFTCVAIWLQISRTKNFIQVVNVLDLQYFKIIPSNFIINTSEIKGNDTT